MLIASTIHTHRRKHFGAVFAVRRCQMQPMERQRGKSGMRPNLWVKCMMDRTPTVSNLKSTTAAVRTAARTTAAMGDARKNVSFEIAVATGSIDSMQDMAEAFTRKIELEKRRGEDLRNRLKVLLGKLSESRKLAPMAVDPESLRQQTAKLHSLEHRLNKLTEKQNRGVRRPWFCQLWLKCNGLFLLIAPGVVIAVAGNFKHRPSQ